MAKYTKYDLGSHRGAQSDNPARPARRQRAADETAAVLQGLLIEVDEACGQCPRALSFSSLWGCA